jgi:hypothetical protein
MTISSQTSRASYTGNGASVTFAVPFYFLAADHLVVYVGGVLKTLTTHYGVTGAGDEAGGSITFTTPPGNAAAVVIYRDPPLTQLLEYTPNGRFPAESHERGLDKLVMIDQRTRELALRSLRLGEADSDGSGAYQANGNRLTDLADPEDDQDAINKRWALDLFGNYRPVGTAAGTVAAGNDARFNAGFSIAKTRAALALATVPAVVQHVLTSGYTAVGDYGVPVALHVRVGSQPAHAGKVQSADGAWWELKARTVTPQMFGAVGNGTTDDQPAFAACVTYLDTGVDRTGGTIYVPRPASAYRMGAPWVLKTTATSRVAALRVYGDDMFTTLLDWNGATGDGIRIEGQVSVNIDDIWIANTQGNGIAFYGPSAGYAGAAWGNRVKNVQVLDAGGAGIYGGDCYLIHCQQVFTRSCGSHGFHFAGFSTTINLQGCSSAENAFDGYYWQNCIYASAWGCTADFNGRYAYSAINANINLYGCGSESNGSTAYAFVTSDAYNATFDEDNVFATITGGYSFSNGLAATGNTSLIEATSSGAATVKIIASGIKENGNGGNANSVRTFGAGSTIIMTGVQRVAADNNVSGGTITILA